MNIINEIQNNNQIYRDSYLSKYLIETLQEMELLKLISKKTSLQIMNVFDKSIKKAFKLKFQNYYLNDNARISGLKIN